MAHNRLWLKIFVGILLVFCVLLAGYWGVEAHVGDIDFNNLINTLDLQIIANAFGSSESSGGPQWNPLADLNEDDKIDLKDLAIAGRSYGMAHSFHRGRYFANTSQTTHRVDACLDGQDQVHIAWSDTLYRNVYYTRLDRFGNTLIDDVLVDSGSSTGTDIVALGCDDPGNAHIFWDCISSVCEARFDQWGYRVVQKKVVDDRWNGAAAAASVDLDSLGRAHLFYRMGVERMIYAMFNENGMKSVSIEEPLIMDSIASRYRQIGVDGNDNIHLVWSEEDGEDRIYYAKLGADPATSIPATIIGYPHWDGSVNSSHSPSLSVDTQGNALVLWNRTNPYLLFLDKISAQGNSLLDDYEIFPDYKSGLFQDLAVDSSDLLHLWAPTGWGSTPYLHAYGSFDPVAQVIEPMRWAMYGRQSYDPQLLIDSLFDTHLVYKVVNETMDEPPCPNNTICYESTAFDSASLDRTRPDLGVDVAHLDWSPTLARWSQTLVITTTIFNAGWAVAPETTAHFEILLNDQTILAPPAQAEAAIPALSPRASHQVTVTLSLPFTPPSGYESMAYADLRVTVDPTQAITENTETNNQISSPIMIQPLPTTAGLFLTVQDMTPTARGASSIPVNIGTATLEGNGIFREIAIKEYITMLADDLPIGPSPLEYQVSWIEDGYLESEVYTVTIGRNPTDPYRIDYNPGNTAALETNTWGRLNGVITEAGTGDPIIATVRIHGQGLNIQTTTDSSGQFSLATDEKLGRLIPGLYQVTLSAPKYARVSGDIMVTALAKHTWNQSMEPTVMAYVRGLVVNQFGRPIPGAQVDACGTIKTTASDGSFDLGEVDEGCSLLAVAKIGYSTYNASISLTAGLESYFDDIILSFDPPVDVIQDEGSFASWKQDESSESLMPEPPEDANWLQEKFYEAFQDEYWPSYRVQVWWGTYEFFLDSAYVGTVDDRYLYQTQLRLNPTTFEAHKVSGDFQVESQGAAVKLTLSSFQDSGTTTALWVVEARLVDADSGTVIQTVRNPVEGGGSWVALTDTTRTYDFGGTPVEDWENAEIWLFVKVGINDHDSWQPSNILQGWHFDQQVIRFDLSEAAAFSDYMIVNFPIP